jgi:hypothetical protein
MTTTARPPTRPGPPPVRAHLAAVLESCGLAAVLTYLGAAVATAQHTIHWWAPMAVILAGGLMVSVVATVATSSKELAEVLTAWTGVLGGWTGWAMISGSWWSWTAVAALAAPAALLTSWTATVWSRHADQTAAIDRAAQARHAAAEREQAREQLTRYGQILGQLGCEGCAATVEEQTRGGKQVTLVLPASGRVTLGRLRAAAENVAVALRLPPGSVTFTDGPPGQVLMWLNETDFLAEDIPFPEDDPPATINEPIALGGGADGEPAKVLLRGVAVYVIGMSGSGKSNLMHVLIAQLTRCPDTVVCVIDLKGGRLAAPWIRPWVEERADEPPISWVATTREEAWDMLTAVRDVVTARAESLAGGSKLTPSPAQPQIIILADEVADIVGQQPGRPAQDQEHTNTQMAVVASELTRKQRSEACPPIWATQRGTVTMAGPGDIKSQCKLRIALATATEADARTILPDDIAAARVLASLQHAGSALIWLPGQRGQMMPVKIYRLDPDEDEHPEDIAKIDRLAVRAAAQPSPEPAALAAMGDRWARRWERSRLYQVLRAGFEGVPVDQLAPEGTPPAGPEGDAMVFQQLMAKEFGAGHPLVAADPAVHGGPGGGDAKTRMFALIADKPLLGLSVMEILTALGKEGMTPRRETVHRWLREAVDADPPRLEQTGTKGTVGARYRIVRRPGD